MEKRDTILNCFFHCCCAQQILPKKKKEGKRSVGVSIEREEKKREENLHQNNQRENKGKEEGDLRKIYFMPKSSQYLSIINSVNKPKCHFKLF